MNGTEYVRGALTNHQLRFRLGNKICSLSNNVVKANWPDQDGSNCRTIKKQ